MSMSRWWTWLRSACMGLCPWAMRRMKAKQVSKMGRPNRRKGTTKEMRVYILNRPWMDTQASTKPRKVEPVSPMKILAGFRL